GKPVAERKASRERRAAGGAAMVLLGPAASLRSRLPNTSILRHQARLVSCPTETIAGRASQPALTTSSQPR
ncbi:MAG TPA: hypothetical protein PLK88_07360, partial [Methanothrix sp.]|nr:hypothetical protein [Methanothrix sp.]